MIQATKFISVPLLLFVVVCLIALPSAVGEAALQSIDIFINIVLPAIFPFMIISGLLSVTRVGSMLSVPLRPFCKYILGIPKDLAPAVLSSMTGGYISGLSALIELRDAGKIDNRCAESCLHFLILPAPPIAITAVGAAMFNSYQLGILIFLAMIVASIELRWLILPKGLNANSCTRRTTVYTPFFSALPTAIARAGSALPIMLASILTANIIIAVLKELGILNFVGILIFKASFGIMNLSDIMLGMGGFIEVCQALSAQNITGTGYSVLVMSFLIAFSGVSVMLQIASLATVQGLSVKRIAHTRLLHAGLTCINLLPVVYLYSRAVPVIQLSTAVLKSEGSIFFESASMLGLTAMLVCLAGRVCTKINDSSRR